MQPIAKKERNAFEKKVSYAHQGCIYLTSKQWKTVKYYYNIKITALF